MIDMDAPYAPQLGSSKTRENLARNTTKNTKVVVGTMNFTQPRKETRRERIKERENKIENKMQLISSLNLIAAARMIAPARWITFAACHGHLTIMHVHFSPNSLEFASHPSAQPPACSSSASTELMHHKEPVARNHDIIWISSLKTGLYVEAADWGKMMGYEFIRMRWDL